MNKKLVLGVTLATGLALGAFASTTAHADEMTTDAGISFDFNKPNGGPFTGNLKLAYVPSDFNFGNRDAKGVVNAVTYNQVFAKGSENEKQYIAVSDDRAAKTAGWNLKANVDDFEYKTKDENDVEVITTLANAELGFTLGETQKYNIDVEDSDKNKAPTPGISTAGSLTALDPTNAAYYVGSPAANSVVTLVADGAEVEVLDYAVPTQAPGEGTLAVAREVSKVTLKVQDHSEVSNKKFNSTVHWTLTADVTP